LSQDLVSVVLQERSEANRQFVVAQISNNSFESLRNMKIQFGDKNSVQQIGGMGPFSTMSVSSEGNDYEFNKVIVYANEGAVQVVKNH
jgi:hypothetical protein